MWKIENRLKTWRKTDNAESRITWKDTVVASSEEEKIHPWNKNQWSKKKRESENAFRIINMTTAIKHSKHLVVELEDKAKKIFQKAR